MSLITSITAKDLWAFVEQQAKAKSQPVQTQVDTSTLGAIEVQKLVEADDLEESAKTLAAKMQNIPFPFEEWSQKSANVLCRKLLQGDKNKDLQRDFEMIPSCPEDSGRSHMQINGERWAANHCYGDYWKPLLVFSGAIAVIKNPSGPTHPGRLIDLCTNERFHSSTVRTGYISPVDGWTKNLPQICKKVLSHLRYEQDQAKCQGLPYKYKELKTADFREACLDLYPCSYHFPPTALHKTINFLQLLNPDLFKDGCRMLDPSAGHGHRLAGALSCPKITYMAATDPNTRMQAGYKKIAEVLGDHLVKNQSWYTGYSFTLNTDIGSTGYHAGTDSKRDFRVVVGKAEDPNNPIYKVDKLYNLVFSSPPFFNTEAYGDGKDQSITSFSTFDAWVEGFLAPMLQNSWNVLEKGGYVAINLTDAHTYQCVEALMKIVTERLKGEYLGMIPSMKAVGASRWTSKEDRKITIHHGIDPIWVFRKS